MNRMKIPLFGGHAIRIDSPVKLIGDWYGIIHPKPDHWKLVVEEIKATLRKKASPYRSFFPWIGRNLLIARLHDYVIKELEKCSPIGRCKLDAEMKPFGVTVAIDRAMYCRWELSILLAHWPNTDKARRKAIDEGLKKTDELLVHLADGLESVAPGSLREFVWPMDMPCEGNGRETALGPLKDRVTVIAEVPRPAEMPAEPTHSCSGVR